jgi:hypothetical protein
MVVAGERLPAERPLAANLEVSRPTARGDGAAMAMAEHLRDARDEVLRGGG